MNACACAPNLRALAIIHNLLLSLLNHTLLLLDKRPMRGGIIPPPQVNLYILMAKMYTVSPYTVNFVYGCIRWKRIRWKRIRWNRIRSRIRLACIRWASYTRVSYRRWRSYTVFEKNGNICIRKIRIRTIRIRVNRIRLLPYTTINAPQKSTTSHHILGSAKKPPSRREIHLGRQILGDENKCLPY